MHYWNKDIFTHVSSLPKADMDPEFRKQQEDSLKYQKYTAKVGDTIFTKAYYAVIESVTLNPTNHDYKREPNDIAIGMRLAVKKLDVDSVWYANPILVLRENQLMSYPEAIAPLRIKTRIPENIFEQVFMDDAKLKYQTIEMQQGEETSSNGLKIKFLAFDKNGTHPNYVKEANDIGVNAVIEVSDGKRTETVRPLFVIRDNRPFAMKDEAIALGAHVKFLSINPKTGAATVAVARNDEKAQALPIEIAENIGRSDYIVLQAIVFPGINYFWIGTILMMFGLTMSWIWRLWQKRKV
jgi:cytochrome c-type biogenesis protein CcmF